MTPNPDAKPELYALDLSNAVWRKSPLSQTNSDCLEYTDLPGGGKAIRDSKNPHFQPLCFDGAEWDAFKRGVQEGLV
ncbi:DUF397 domain-containing protein [Kitasatospora sp. NPDC008050]|uniref:DUF397 domain-containing protein n=1 Tax=Kitasatospora sp. NPDC008050 TaxID=3364021 RepID=UPI0036E2D9B6